jgi:sensor domain CHASE-containing protein
MTKSLRWVCANVRPRVVDFLAILVAGVASVAIIINAVFLQSDRGTYEPEHLVTKLQKTHEALKFERGRLQHKIDNASARN